MRFLLPVIVAAASACTDPTEPPHAGAPSHALVEAGEDDGTYLARIDPLGGQWLVERVGADDFTVYDARIDFSAGGFLNHSAGCSGGFPAFYRLSGDQLAITRLEPVRTGKCSAAAAENRTVAAASEQQLAAFLDQLSTWRRTDDRTLVLTGKDGTEALLTRPLEPYPELAGRWLIESIGKQPFETERRPPILSISMGGIGAYADCNSMGGEFSISQGATISVKGPLVSTAIGCPPEDAAEDALLAKAITSATAYHLQDDRLVLTGGPGMSLRRPSPPSRILVGEYEACGNTLLGGYHEGPITLAIDSQKMRDNAGCAADYVAEGPQLALRLQASMACTNRAAPYEPGKPVGVGGSISTLAVAQPDGYAFDDQGRLILHTARGLLTMCRKGDPLPFGG